MTTTHNPATMIAASSTQAPTIPAGYAFIGVVVVLAAVALAWGLATRKETKLLRAQQRALAAARKAGDAKLRPDSGRLQDGLVREAMRNAANRATDMLTDFSVVECKFTDASKNHVTMVIERPEVVEYLPTQ